jgi:phosphate transport system protein
MSELQIRLDRLTLRLDHLGMRVEQALLDALHAVENADAEAGEEVHRRDKIIDREEVMIEQECIRLLALYQPTAVDLRSLCMIIKVNNDLERIADFAANIGHKAKYVASEGLDLRDDPEFVILRQETVDVVGRTARMLGTQDVAAAKTVIESDKRIDGAFRHLVRDVLARADDRPGGAETAMTVFNLGKALERIGDLCTNIAEEIIFLRTGDIVRHAGKLGGTPAV